MGELGSVLALLHGAHTNFRSFVGVAEYFYDPGVRYAALDRAGSTGAPLGALGMRSDPVSEELWTLWVEQPSRMRAEQTGRRGCRSGSCTKVVDGQRWWTWDQKYGARYWTGNPQEMASTGTGFEKLLDPRQLLATMRGFSLGMTTSVAGREVIRLHARYGGHLDDLLETEIAVDAERGVALRVIERFDGQIVEVREFTSVQFDVPIEAEVFTFVPPDGEDPLPMPVSTSVSVEEAALVCPFSVYVPAEIPDGSEVELTYWPGWQRDPLPGPTVSVGLRHDGHLVTIEQWEGFRCCLNEPSPPQAVSRNGQTVLVTTDGYGRHSIQTRRGDTGIELRCKDLDLLVSIATCLVPVSATDPPAWSPAPLPKHPIFAVPVPRPALPPSWRHPDIVTPPGLGALLEVVYGGERRRAPLRATVTSTWYGGEPRSHPPVTRQEEVSVDADQGPVSWGTPYGDLLEPARLIATLDFEFGDPAEVDGRRAVCATATGCAWMCFPRQPPGINIFSTLIGGVGVTRLDLVIDAEAGFLLAATTWAGDRMIREVKMESVTVG